MTPKLIHERRNGSRLATVEKIGDRFLVWVGYDLPTGESWPALFFNGHRTCSKSFVRLDRAYRAVNAFLGG